MALVFFSYFALVSIVAGVLTVSMKHPVHCALALLALLLHVSGLFIMLNAEFLWAVQVIVYVGAILVLYLFVLMLLNLKTDERYFHAKTPYLLAPAVIGTVYLLVLMVRSPLSGVKGDVPATAILQQGDTYAVGIKMFSEYLLPFEIIGVFLTGAIVGAIVLAKTPKTLEGKRET
ncbi:MAG TPA: NADH-quinone oxidoreductase subunit J [Nitrospiraceae bacterium]|jgi:NADH-quinone oxidoreductase subunit J|nr:NADH-quinone oxidoreductase subunit J [Nitrospiraceae bacterium]